MNLWQWTWCKVWWLSETTKIPLGRFAPWVFHQMIGCDKPAKKVSDKKCD